MSRRVLTYNDLKSLEPARDARAPSREIEMHLTGNMEAFIWGIDELLLARHELEAEELSRIRESSSAA